MNKVVIKSYSGTSSDPYDYRGLVEITEVIVNGESICVEGYGGEPEDNMRCRDYKWVEPLIKKISELLGAEVKVEKVENLPNGW